MAPRGVSPLSHAVVVSRCSRKRQSRRIGSACRGRRLGCIHREACKLIPISGLKEVRANEQDEQAALSTHTCSTESDPVELDGGVANLKLDVSKANVATETSDQDTETEILLRVQIREQIAEELSTQRKSVRFDFAATSIHEVIPYGEIYGAHPRRFVFDKDSQMIPAARGGFVSAGFTSTADEDEDEGEDGEEEEGEDDSSLSHEDVQDGGWETWLLEQADDLPSEFDEVSSAALTHDTCLPDLDDEAGWETWLDNTLGSTLDELEGPEE